MCLPGSQISPAHLYYPVSAPWIRSGSLISSRPPGQRESEPLRVLRRFVQAEHILRLQALGLPLLVLLLVLLQPVRAQNPKAQDVSMGVDWLTRYGYLPPADPVHAQLQSLRKLQDAIKVMQRFAGLPETGQMDPITIATMRKPRCSLPDILGAAGLVRRRRRYSLSGSVWKKRTLTWSIRSFSQSSQLSQSIVRTLVSYALAVWATESGLTFQEVNPQDQEPDIIIHFARAYHQDSYPFDGPGGTLAHAFFPGEHPISGDTHFDDEETWTYGSTGGEGIDLFAVAVHEFGHALGLGHSSAPNSIMRPFYQGPVGNPSTYRLSQDDRDGLQQLYGKVSQTPNDRPPRKPLAPPPQPPVMPPDSPSTPVPDRCEGNFDAVANIRGEIFFFKGPWFWRLQPSGQLVSNRPAGLHRFWEGLPTHVRVIQAAYARPLDGRIILFSGPQFWVFQERQLEGVARSLVEFGLPPGEEVDAVFSWPLNGKTYLIRGQKYWRYDEVAARPDPGYPHALSLWEGAPFAPDDVTTSNTGDTYFFKGTHFWRFAKGSVKAESDSPQPIGSKWLDCSDPQVTSPPKTTSKTRSCDCHCELNQASKQLSTLLLPLLPLLAGAVFSC
ncbi:matrix metalloproteinase-25 [Grammomys surdaster]|uniref:matrix metalloproteinase-25 n=1 Tax=Grammomys surdaster TaxID=491861 RepID=UPI00109F2B09|nr:matrix metalloproteinase-25 [Grammomys surdaster]